MKKLKLIGKIRRTLVFKISSQNLSKILTEFHILNIIGWEKHDITNRKWRKIIMEINQVIINVSARHVHLKQEHLEVSIGKD